MHNNNDYERILFYPTEGNIIEIDITEISYRTQSLPEQDSSNLSNLEKEVKKIIIFFLFSFF